VLCVHGCSLNWDAVGAIAELMGATGVILTLIYLATQLRQNTKALRSSMYQAYNASSMQISDTFLNHADLLTKIRERQELTAAETLQAHMLGAKLFSQMETIFLHYQEGMVSDEVFESRMMGFKKTLAGGMTMGSWTALKEYDLAKSFVKYVDNELLGQDA
jgi:hypothetical protein